jgi:4-alpha-glucanotransferase
MVDRDKILSKKRAGVSLSLLSLLSKKSFECGDFYSLHLLKDWAKKSNLSIIQLLPLNDMGFGRSPYSSISAMAIDPIYISLHLLGIPQYSRSKFIKTLDVNTKRVRQIKMDLLLEHFTRSFDANLQKKLDAFISTNPWLSTYGVFRTLYTKNMAQHWRDWSYGSTYSKEIETEVIQTEKQSYYYFVWLQWVCFEQLSAAKKELESVGLFLKGDMPILTSGNSSDVWSRPDLFIHTMTTGAPPDYFNSEGQNWGFPVINWVAMRNDNYKWWQDRLSYVQNFYHLYRIDHVLGMFRIWAIPLDAKSAKYGYFYPQKGVARRDFNKARLIPEEFVKLGLIYEFEEDKFIFYWDFHQFEGYQALPEEMKAKFYPLSYSHIKEDEEYWLENGESVLDFLYSHSDMLPCAEDLGAVPGFVRDCIHEREIIGMDIIRWTKSFEDGTYLSPEKYRSNAVSALSVHDTSITLAWWDELSVEEKKSFMEALDIEEYTTKENFAQECLRYALSTNSQFSIQLLQDYIFERDLSHSVECERELDIIDAPQIHRINTPGTPENKNWGYRYPFFVEELLERTSISSRIAQLVIESGRE